MKKVLAGFIFMFTLISCYSQTDFFKAYDAYHQRYVNALGTNVRLAAQLEPQVVKLSNYLHIYKGYICEGNSDSAAIVQAKIISILSSDYTLDTLPNCAESGSGGTTDPAGSDYYVQYNSSGLFAGDAGFLYYPSSDSLFVEDWIKSSRFDADTLLFTDVAIYLLSGYVKIENGINTPKVTTDTLIINSQDIIDIASGDTIATTRYADSINTASDYTHPDFVDLDKVTTDTLIINGQDILDIASGDTIATTRYADSINTASDYTHPNSLSINEIFLDTLDVTSSLYATADTVRIAGGMYLDGNLWLSTTKSLYFDNDYYVNLESVVVEGFKFVNSGAHSDVLYFAVRDDTTGIYNSDLNGIKITGDSVIFVCGENLKWDGSYLITDTDTVAWLSDLTDLEFSGDSMTLDELVIDGSTKKIYFGDLDTYIHESADDNLKIYIGTVATADINSDGIESAISGGFTLRRNAGTTAVPFLTRNDNTTSGYGAEGEDTLNIIVNSTTQIQITEDTTYTLNALKLSDTLFLDYLAYDASKVLSLTPDGGVNLVSSTGNPVLTDVDEADTTRWGTIGSGEVDTVGVPNTNALGVFASASRLEGDSLLQWDGSNLIIDRNYGLKFTDAAANVWRIFQEDANKLEFEYEGSQSFEFINSTPDYLTGAANSAGYAALKNSVGTSIDPVYSFVDDLNTGVGWAGADQMSLIAGGGETMRITTDSIVARDSVYLDYLGVTAEAFIVITSTGALDTGQLVAPGYVILHKEELPSFKSYYEDVKKVNGYPERKWITGYRNGDFTWSRKLPNNPRAIEMLQAAIEQRDEYLKDLYEQNESQQLRIECLERENAQQRELLEDLKTRIEKMEGIYY